MFKTQMGLTSWELAVIRQEFGKALSQTKPSCEPPDAGEQ